MRQKSFLKNNKISCCVAIVAISVFFFGYGNASAAVLQIGSNSATVSSGNTMTLSVMLNSEGVAVNNVEAKIIFPKDLFEVVSISKSGSFLSLWVEDPAFSNLTGIITFNGGIPTPGFMGSNGTVLSITVRAKKAGQAEIIFSDSAVRANDGLGTNVLNSKNGKIISIINKINSEVVKEVTTSPAPTLQISSLTHPNQDQWYKDKNPIFQWVIPTGADAVQTGIDNNASGTPRVAYSPAISEKTVKDLSDGVWYFKVRARRDRLWGATDTYITRIDTTSPQKKNVDFLYDDNKKVLNITADVQDTTSGIDRYEIFINNNLVKTVPAKEFVGGKYSYGFNASGNNVVKLLVIDRAGNSVESLGNFYSASIMVPQLDPVSPLVSINEQLLIRGVTQNPNMDVVVNVRNADGETTLLNVKSDSVGRFIAMAPKLRPGNYDIWIEAGLGDSKTLSLNTRTRVTSEMLISIGSFTVTALYLIGSILFVMIPLILIAVYFGIRYGRFHYRPRMRAVLENGDNSKVLRLLKKGLEKHLQILQYTRRDRILSKEEKDIKEAIEGDLDEVDRAIEEQGLK